MFSMGCIVAELYTGYPLFPANDECELLEFQTAMLGPIPHYMIEDSQKFNQFFSIDEHNIVNLKRSKHSRLDRLKAKNNLSLEAVLFTDDFTLSEEQSLMLDFIKKCLIFDPTARMTCEEAL
jgi:dual specificity tyrosine-phosphorylation-regulated kinase 2/3/4